MEPSEIKELISVKHIKKKTSKENLKEIKKKTKKTKQRFCCCFHVLPSTIGKYLLLVTKLNYLAWQHIARKEIFFSRLNINSQNIITDLKSHMSELRNKEWKLTHFLLRVGGIKSNKPCNTINGDHIFVFTNFMHCFTGFNAPYSSYIKSKDIFLI